MKEKAETKEIEHEERIRWRLREYNRFFPAVNRLPSVMTWEEGKGYYRVNTPEESPEAVYERLPWQTQTWFHKRIPNTVGLEGPWDATTLPGLHFAHVSVEDKSMVAFTASEEHGVADRQTRMKPGKYLKKYYGDVLSDDEIAKLAAEFGAHFAPPELSFATDADEIERVYRDGPRSCMAYHPGDYASPCHPVRVYAGPDLALAYIERGAGNITARALVWPDKKRYGRVYGDEQRIVPLLRAAGYSYGSLSGARIQRIPVYNGGFVMPYIDGIDYATDEGDYIRIGGFGSIYCQNTNGLSDERNYCPHCEEYYNPHEGSYWIADVEQEWCPSCRERDAFYCEGIGEYFSDNTESVEIGYYRYSLPYVERNPDEFFKCDECGEGFSYDRTGYGVTRDGRPLCEHCIADLGLVPDENDELVDRETLAAELRERVGADPVPWDGEYRLGDVVRWISTEKLPERSGLTFTIDNDDGIYLSFIEDGSGGGWVRERVTWVSRPSNPAMLSQIETEALEGNENVAAV